MKKEEYLRKWWGDDYFDNHEEFKADFDSVIADSIAEREAEKQDIVCPFCGDDDFDKIGLKIHLLNYCEAYQNTPIADKVNDELPAAYRAEKGDEEICPECRKPVSEHKRNCSERRDDESK
jgi:ribosomal protein L37AE/L43A